MATINHKVQFLNQDGTGYDTYHSETNVSQVYDFSKSKWLNEIIADLERELANITGGIDVTELNESLNLTMQDLDSVESLVNAIQTELAKKYVKPETGITLEDLNENIKTSLANADRVETIEIELNKVRVDLKTYIDEEINKINTAMRVHTEEFVATENQSSFELVNANNLDISTIRVEVGGVEQFTPENYTKNTDDNGVTTIKFTQALPEGIEVVVNYYGGMDAVNTVVESHIGNKNIHVTEEEKIAINDLRTRLTNVDNTSDIDKPVSTAQREAIDDAKEETKRYTDSQVQGLVADGIPKLVSHEFLVTATADGQQDYTFTDALYSGDNDTVLVFFDGEALNKTEYTIAKGNNNDITISIEDTNAIVGSIVRVLIFRNVPIGSDGAINASVLIDGTITQKKLHSDVVSYFAKQADLQATFEEVERTGVRIDSLESKNKPYINVKDYGAKGDGVTDDTSAFNDVINYQQANGGIILIPQGAYLISRGWGVSNLAILGVGMPLIKLSDSFDGSKAMGVFQVFDGTINIKGIIIDGNKANLRTVPDYGILGYRTTRIELEDVIIFNMSKIGIGLSNTKNTYARNCEVTFSGNNKPGIWADYDISEEYADANIVFENCKSNYNDLDGFIINVNRVKFFNCEAISNGIGSNFGGALGAGGIYSDRSIAHIVIDNCRCDLNTEFGINIITYKSRITNTTCEANGLTGIALRSGSSRVQISNCHSVGNGTSDTTANPTLWGKSGIQFDGVTFVTITSCTCIDNKAFGISCMNTQMSNGIIVTSNNLSYNVADTSNIHSGYQSVNITNLVYQNNF